MSNHSFSRISDEEIEHSIFLFIHSFFKFRQANKIQKEIFDLHQILLVLDPNQIPINFAEFLKLIREVPINEIVSIKARDSIMGDMLKKPLFINDRLSEEANEFYLDYLDNKKDLKQNQQENMKAFLLYCRSKEEKNRFQEFYNLVRVKLYNKNFYINGQFGIVPEVNIMLEAEFNEYLMEVALKYDLTSDEEQYIHNLYQTVFGPKEFLICNFCHMPMFDENNCHNNHVCFSDKKKNREDNRKFILKSGQKAYIPKAGLAFYNIIPGITEYKIYWNVKEEFENKGMDISLFPNIERDGDIEVKFNNNHLLIDVKDYRKPEDLVAKINSEAASFIKVDMICIPKHRSKYTDYLKVLNDNLNWSKLAEYRLKPPLQIVKEDDLIAAIYKWIIKSQNGGLA